MPKGLDATGDYSGPRLDLSGRYLLPGLIDSHLHPESSRLTPLGPVFFHLATGLRTGAWGGK
jgi:adenine deaminase